MKTMILQGITVVGRQIEAAINTIEQLKLLAKEGGDITWTPATGALMVFVLGEERTQTALGLLRQLEPYLAGGSRFVLQDGQGALLGETFLGPEKGAIRASTAGAWY
jgi:hypothetical protein